MYLNLTYQLVWKSSNLPVLQYFQHMATKARSAGVSKNEKKHLRPEVWIFWLGDHI